jgi:hypothetical protein
MKSLMGRLLVLLTVVAMLLAVSGPAAMANDFDGFFGDSLDNADCGIFGDRCDNNLDNENCGIFGDRCDNQEGLDVIRVGDLRCLVEDGDDVDFCVNKHTGEIVRDF